LGILKTDAFSFVPAVNRLHMSPALAFRGVSQYLEWYFPVQYHAFDGVMLDGRCPFIRRIITDVN
jgi:hypothetical protein